MGQSRDAGRSISAVPTPVSSVRQVAVDRAREAWIRRLIDLSRRNNLLYYRELRAGTLDLLRGDPDALAALLSGEAVGMRQLLPGADMMQTAARVRAIRQRAVLNLEERGIETLFVALGMATWTPGDDGRPPAAAVLLLPVAIEARGREYLDVVLRRTGDVQINLVLLHVLETLFGIHITPDTLLDGALQEDDSFDVDLVLGRLSELCPTVPGFVVSSAATLSNFSFQKLAMVRDLRDRAAELSAHDVIAAIAGDAGAREQLQHHGTVDVASFDHIAPDDEFLILDADASQQRVVANVLAGQHGVIQGPPGTGKSQTIANMIAALAAQGKRVLFVAEKRAALEVVARRLSEEGLGHLLLDLHGADVSRRTVMRRFAESLDVIRTVAPTHAGDVHARFVDRRARLRAHAEQLHAPRAPSGLSVYALLGRLLRLPAQPRSTVRWRGANLQPLSGPVAMRVHDLLMEAGGFGGLFLRDDPSPWCGACLATGDDAQRATDLVARLLDERWPALRDAVAALVETTGAQEPQTLADATSLLRLLGDVNATLIHYDAALFTHDLPALVASLEPMKAGWAAVAWARMTNRAFRVARAAVRELRRAPAADTQIYAEIVVAADQRLRWDGQAAGLPRSAPRCEQVLALLETFESEIRELAGLLARPALLEQPFVDLVARLEALGADPATPYRLPRLLEIEQALTQVGAGLIVDELRRTTPPTDQWALLFEHAWLQSCLDAAMAAAPELAGFNGATHAAFVDEFAALDRQRREIASARVRRTQAERAVARMNAHPDQTLLVRREAEKKSRHLPLRRLMAMAPDVLTALRPCWMASPLSVSQLLDGRHQHFEVVIFDEASQVPPEDAMAALLRGAQVVVAGDKHQLPPTLFFAAGEGEGEETEETGATEGFESILDLLTAFFEPWMLQWHYRSRDESLIAFSNQHIYDRQLITFPSTGKRPAVSHVPVTQAAPGLDEESVAEEVRQVVSLVIEHAARRPDQTLGVITMGINHAQRVEDALDVALRSRPDLDDFFDQQRDERFFVKNLERVQGDERDAIILSIGYGKDRSGRLPYRFGPLLQRGGERRLNVAITRARHAMTVVSSFSADDMDPHRSSARGVELLGAYLLYASNPSPQTHASDPGLPPLEADVLAQLSARGLPVVPRYGASDARIDIALGHASDEERFVIALETDGLLYRAVPTVRDRDRLRRQQLESLGWRHRRLWVLDWYHHREREIARIVDAYMDATARAAEPVATNTAAPAAVGATRIVSTTPPATGATVRLDQAPAQSTRGARPKVGRRDSITAYSHAELVALVRWIGSDGRLRTDDEVIDEMIDELGFSRRGPRILAAIRRALAEVAASPR